MYYSFINTPQKIIKLVTRFTSFNLLSYYPATENVDNRKLSILNMNENEIELKRNMLLGFVSQNGNALCMNYGYKDRLVKWTPKQYKSQAFNYVNNLSAFIEKMYVTLPASLANKIYPTDIVSHGCSTGITDLDYELGKKVEK